MNVGATVKTVVRTLLVSDLVDSTRLVEQMGDRRFADLGRRHDRLARDLMLVHDGLEIDKSDGFLLLFARPLSAVLYALAYHQALRQLAGEEGCEIQARVGIHLGEVVLRENEPRDVARGAKPIEVEGLAKPMAARLMSLAGGGQTLLTPGAFNLARRGALDVERHDRLRWLAHGDYLLKGVEQPVRVFEVGREGQAPLTAPRDSLKAHRVSGTRRVLGWRPAPGLRVPWRDHWMLDSKLGEGGFGETWLAAHHKTGERRVFKFCYDATRLGALQREITIFRLLKGELGAREDIGRVLDWSFDEAPYYIERDYSAGGSLEEWVETQGGFEAVPLAIRLEIVAQVATALAAAHSVGVLHKDVKPSNVLIDTEPEGNVRSQLTDFGIGHVMEQERLVEAGITALGLTEASEEGADSPAIGTRLYMAPEVLEGKPATLQADIYALGVMLYQFVVGDFRRRLAPGWRRDIADELLAEDIACFVDRSPTRRPAGSREVAERLRNLEARRAVRQEAVATRHALALAHRRRRLSAAIATAAIAVLAVVSVFAAWAMKARREEARARHSAERVSDFLVEIFEMTDPYGKSDPGARRGETLTAREILDRGAGKLEEGEFAGEPLIRARLTNTIGAVYSHLGLYDAAEPLIEEALSLRRQTPEGELSDLAASLAEKASLLRAKGNYEAAEPLYRESLEMRRRGLGEEHSDVATSLADLAWLLRAKGDYEGAEPLYRDSLAMRRRLLGDEHLDVATSLNNLALLLYFKGDYEGAAPLYRDSLEVQRRVLGEQHPDVATSLNNLASLYKAKGDYERAEPLYRDSLAMRRHLLGEEHPDVAASLNNLGVLLKAKGDYERAEPLYRESLKIQRRLLGDEHPDVATGLNNLAWLLQAKGDYDRAETLARESLEMKRRLLGGEHPQVAASLNSLASLLQTKGDYEGAESLVRESLEMQRRLLGEEHPRVATSLNHLASVLQAKGDYEAAESLVRESLEMQRRLLGGEHPHVAASLNHLALLLQAKGDNKGAEPLYRDSLEMRRRLLGDEHPGVASSLNNLAELRLVQGFTAEGEELIREALAIFQQALPPGHWRISNAESILGACFTELGHYREAEALILKSYPIVRDEIGRSSPKTRAILARLVVLYEEWGKPAKAAEHRALLIAADGVTDSE